MSFVTFFSSLYFYEKGVQKGVKRSKDFLIPPAEARSHEAGWNCAKREILNLLRHPDVKTLNQAAELLENTHYLPPPK